MTLKHYLERNILIVCFNHYSWKTPGNRQLSNFHNRKNSILISLVREKVREKGKGHPPFLKAFQVKVSF